MDNTASNLIIEEFKIEVPQIADKPSTGGNFSMGLENVENIGSGGYMYHGGGWEVVNLYYYENILAPYITGYVNIVSTSDVVVSQFDKQERKVSLSANLDVGQKILMKVRSRIGTGIDFSSEDDEHKQLYIVGKQIIERNSQKETIQLRFTSKIGYLESTKTLGKSYDGPISQSVEKILKNEFKLSSEQYEVDETKSTYKFNGQELKPFEWFLLLAKQSIPAKSGSGEGKANPGYFSYQTKNKFKFKSIDGLIKQDPYPQIYSYNGAQTLNQEYNDYKISSLTVYKDQDLIEQIDTGVYASKTIFFNPASYKFKEVDISVDGRKLLTDEGFNTLGPTIGVPTPVSVELENGKKYHKIYTSILDVEEVGGEAKTNNSPELYHAATAARYNILFSQKYGITIPCNTDLEAGMSINLELENISYCSKEMGPDEKNSGTYIIQSLCHYLDSTKSVTSLEVIRDSYGLSFQRDDSGDDSGKLLTDGKGLFEKASDTGIKVESSNFGKDLLNAGSGNDEVKFPSRGNFRAF